MFARILLVSLFFVCSLLASVPLAAAQDCVDYVPQGIRIMDTTTMAANVSYDIEVIGDVGIVGTSNGLYAVDLSDPENFTVLGFYEQFGCISLAVIGNLVGISSQDDGLIFVDASDPTSMTLVREYPEFTYSQDIVAHGDYFYVGHNHLGVIAVDATDRANPLVTNLVDVNERVVRVAARGDQLYTVSYDSQLVTWSLADPALPVVQYISSNYRLGNASSLLVNGNYLYLSTYSNGLNVANVTYPNPVHVGNVPTTGHIYTLALLGGYLFGGYEPSVQAFDLTIPAAPELFGRLVSSLEVWDLEVHGDHLVGVAADNIVFSMDVSQPESTLPLGLFNTGGNTQDVTFGATHMFLAQGQDGVLVRSINNTSYPAEIPTAGFVHTVTLHDDLAYLAMDAAGLQIVDVSSPAAPVLLDDINTSGHAHDVAIYHHESGTYAMVADDEYDLAKYDVTDPTHILPKGINYFPGRVFAVEVKGDHVLVADNSGFLRVLDLSVFPDQPQVVASLELAGAPSNLLLIGDTLFVGGSLWLSSVDVSDPASPVLLDAVELPGSIVDLDLQGGLLYCALAGGTMQIIDVRDPVDMLLLKSFRSRHEINGIAARSDRVYLCAGDDGFVYLPLQCAPAISAVGEAVAAGGLLKPAYPNPFNPMTTISFELPRAADVSLRIFDLKGRQVRTLLSGQSREAEAHSVRWDGLDDRGHAVPSGVYFYQLQAGQVKETGRMALIR